MKYNILKFIMLLFIGNAFLSSCSTETDSISTTDDLKNELIFTKNINGVKVIFGKNIKEEEIIETQDGVVFLFDKKGNYYKNLITVIPHNSEEKKELISFLKKGDISFEYRLETIIFLNSKKERLIFTVNNKKGIEFAKHFKKSDPVFYCNQLAFSKNNKFITSQFKSDILKTKTNNFIGIVISKEQKNATSNKGCTSGGTGSTSCSVGDIYSSCSVSCGSGYYACCQDSDNTCHCIDNSPQQ